MDPVPAEPRPHATELPPPPQRITIASIRPRAILMVVGTLVALSVTVWVLRESRQAITWIVIAGFLALALNPLVDLLQRRLRIRRVPAISLAYLLGLAVVAGISLLLVPPLVDAGQQLADDAPGYVDRLSETRLVQRLDERYDVVDRMREFVNDLPDRLGGAGAAVDAAQTVVTGVFATITVLVLTFLMLIYGRRIRDQAIALAAPERQERYHTLVRRMYRTVGGYVSGTVAIALLSGISSYVMLRIVGVPSAAALAFFVGLMGLIPLVGATIGAIPAIAVAFFQGLIPGLIATAYFVVYQQLENNFIQPNVMRRTTSINPLAVLIAVLIGASLFGVLGAVVAIPVAGAAKILLEDWWEHRPGRPAPEAEPPAEAPPDGPAPDEPPTLPAT